MNEGGSLNRSFSVNLEGRVSNKGAVGAKVALRAGSLKQKIEQEIGGGSEDLFADEVEDEQFAESAFGATVATRDGDTFDPGQVKPIDLAVHDPGAFTSLVELAKKAQG